MQYVEINLSEFRYKRLKKIIAIITSSDCHEVISHKSKVNSGYTGITINKKRRRLHRILYEDKFGKIPENYVICHKCNNPKCVNINHLYAGTRKQNQEDMVRASHSNRGEKYPLSKLTRNDVFYIRKNYIKGNRGKKGNTLELAKKYNIHPMHVTRIARKGRWQWLDNT